MKDAEITWPMINEFFVISGDLHEMMRDHSKNIADSQEVETEVQKLENWLHHYRQLNPQP